MLDEIICKEENHLNDPPFDTIIDLADSCRTCLGLECSLTPTNSLDSDSIKFCDKLAACVSGMKWARVGEPSFICGICIEKLRIAYDFQTTCLQSDQVFRLQGEANKIHGSRSATPDCTATTSLAECDEAMENVILTIKPEETQVQILSQDAVVNSDAAQLEAIQMLDNSRKSNCEVCGEESCEHIPTHTTYTKTRTGEKFSCKLCDKKFTRSSSLNRHMRRHNGDQLSRRKICNKRFTRPRRTERTGKHAGKKCSCRLCGREFKHASELSIHKREHTGKQPYKCTLCDKICRNNVQLKDHIMQHNGEKLICSTCGKKFTNTQAFKSHLKIHISGETFKCSYCDRIFFKFSILKRHSHIHTGEKFSCNLCGGQFITYSQLLIHKQRHTGKQRHKCTLCDKVCHNALQLQNHMMRHTGEKLTCSKCGQKFTSGYSLNFHLKAHAGENKFKCSSCDRTFLYSSALKRHVTTHTGEKPFDCEFCGKKFTRSAYLNIHVKKHTRKTVEM